MGKITKYNWRVSTIHVPGSDIIVDVFVCYTEQGQVIMLKY